MDFDVVVVGGSVAGLSAATYLARASRKILVIDSGLPRNRYAAHSHGVLGLDGMPGTQILQLAREQLSVYPSARQLTDKVRRIENDRVIFHVETESNGTMRARKIILATGFIDRVPEIPGLQERWGVTVLHCPYCHGYEIGGGPLGVIGTLPLSTHQASLVADWGEVTFFANGLNFDEAERDHLLKRKVRIEERLIKAIRGEAPAIESVELADGKRISVKAIFIAAPVEMSAPFADQLGCAFSETPIGRIVVTDSWKATTVPGIYAAGDLSRFPNNIAFASADGVAAALGAHQALISDQSEIT